MERPPDQPASWLHMSPTKPEVWLHAAPNGEQGPNISLNDYLEEPQNLAVPPQASEIPPPIRERLPRRKKGVNVWACVCTLPTLCRFYIWKDQCTVVLTVPPVRLRPSWHESQRQSLSALPHSSVRLLPSLPIRITFLQPPILCRRDRCSNKRRMNLKRPCNIHWHH